MFCSRSSTGPRGLQFCIPGWLCTSGKMRSPELVNLSCGPSLLTTLVTVTGNNRYYKPLQVIIHIRCMYIIHTSISPSIWVACDARRLYVESVRAHPHSCLANNITIMLTNGYVPLNLVHSRWLCSCAKFLDILLINFTLWVLHESFYPFSQLSVVCQSEESVIPNDLLATLTSLSEAVIWVTLELCSQSFASVLHISLKNIFYASEKHRHWLLDCNWTNVGIDQ